MLELSAYTWTEAVFALSYAIAVSSVLGNEHVESGHPGWVEAGGVDGLNFPRLEIVSL